MVSNKGRTLLGPMAGWWVDSKLGRSIRSLVGPMVGYSICGNSLLTTGLLDLSKAQPGAHLAVGSQR